MSKFETPVGQLGRRIHGARQELLEGAQSARAEAVGYENDMFGPFFAASLRGKAKGYDEAADLLAALDQGRRIPKRRHWTGWVPPVRSNRRSVALGDAETLQGAQINEETDHA